MAIPSAPTPRPIPTYREFVDSAVKAKVVHEHWAPLRVHGIDNAILISEMLEAGPPFDPDGPERVFVAVVEAETVRWFASVAMSNGGKRDLRTIAGSWPDQMSASYPNWNGVAVWPGFHLLGAAGSTEVPALELYDTVGVRGVARVGSSTLVMRSDSSNGEDIRTVQGPKLERPRTPAPAPTCKDGEPLFCWRFAPPEKSSAVCAAVFAGTTQGTLVAVGEGCESRVMLEIWDPSGKPRVVDAPGLFGKDDNAFASRLRRGTKDDLWLVSDKSGNVHHFVGGAFVRLGRAPGSIDDQSQVTVSPDGQLYVSHPRGVVRHDGKSWSHVLKFGQPHTLASLAVDGKGAVWATLPDSGQLLLLGGS